MLGKWSQKLWFYPYNLPFWAVFLQFLDVFVVEIQQILASKEFNNFQQLKPKSKTPADKRGIFRPQLLYYDIILRRKNIPNIEQSIRKKHTKKHAKKQVFKTVFKTVF